MPHVPIIFSRHALIKLEQRGLTKEAVIKTIMEPVYITAVADQFHAFRKFGRLYLKVIFARSEKRIIVITQYLVRKLP